MDVRTLEAGRELDAAIAEKVIHQLKWTAPGRAFFNQSLAVEVFPGGVNPKLRHYPDGSPRWEQGDGDRWFSAAIPHYSTDMADAWQIVEKLQSGHDCEIELTYDSGVSRYHVRFHGRMTMVGASYAATAPLAICRAALELIETECH